MFLPAVLLVEPTLGSDGAEVHNAEPVASKTHESDFDERMANLSLGLPGADPLFSLTFG
jgi:hypothetical protein